VKQWEGLNSYNHIKAIVIYFFISPLKKNSQSGHCKEQKENEILMESVTKAI
jgi:hypothetical protein